MKKDAVRFDDAIPVAVRVVNDILGEAALREGVIVRDVSGRVCFVCPKISIADNLREDLATRLKNALSAYSFVESPVLFADDDDGVQDLLNDPGKLPMLVENHWVNLLDRRVVGQGWLQAPSEEIATPPRIVFASIKGGVGRSTALTVLAADFARRGRNVLVVDLDLEAPGLGDLRLQAENAPIYGVIDYLVESGIGDVPDELLADFIGSSTLTSSAGGKVDVMPAFGTRSVENSENILSKLSRSMIESIDKDGSVVSVVDHISNMIARVSNMDLYDVVLIDSRAGLAELAAPAVLGLGGLVLLFGTAQKQTITGYKALFSGLKLLAQRDLSGGKSADWRLRFKAVIAKASLNDSVLERHSDELYELFSEEMYDSDAEENSLGEALQFVHDDASAPHTPLVIPADSRFVDFDPTRTPTQLTEGFYESVYRPFLNGVDHLLSDILGAPAYD